MRGKTLHGVQWGKTDSGQINAGGMMVCLRFY